MCVQCQNTILKNKTVHFITIKYKKKIIILHTSDLQLYTKHLYYRKEVKITTFYLKTINHSLPTLCHNCDILSKWESKKILSDFFKKSSSDTSLMLSKVVTEIHAHCICAQNA